MMKAMRALIEGLSHELVNKVATLQMKQKGIEKILPALTNGYNVAVQNNLIQEGLSKRMLAGVDDLTNLNEQLMPMLDILSRVNLYMEIISKKKKESEHSIQNCIHTVLAQAPFNSSEDLKKIQVKSQDDFLIFCPNLFVETALYHILYELLRCESVEVVQIFLSREQNILTITGHQEAFQSSRASIFEHYCYESYDKMRPGLGLCRLVFQVFGGDIFIDKAGEYQLAFNLSCTDSLS